MVSHPSRQTQAPRSKLEWIAAGLLVVAFFAQCLSATAHRSVCNDEGKHLATGWWLLSRGSCCLGVDNTPLTAYHVLPLLLLDHAGLGDDAPQAGAHAAGRQLLFDSPAPLRLLLACRATTVVAGALLLIGAGVLARRYYGPGAELVTLFALAFEPNFLAHSGLVSPDAMLAVTVIFALLAFDSCLRRPRLWRALLAGATLGLVLLAKFTGFLMLFLLPLLGTFYAAQLRRYPWQFWLTRGLLALGAFVAVMWLGYGAWLSPVPPWFAFPGLIVGFNQALDYARNGMNAYFMGQVGRHWRLYFVHALLLKTPLPLLLAWGLAAAACVMARGRVTATRWVPLVAALVFFGAAVRSNLNLGVRHILPVYVLMAVAAGGLAPWLRAAIAARRWLWPASVLGLGMWLVIESQAIYPFHLSYFNQLAGGPRGGIRYLGDSNLDWGQDLATLKHVMDDLGIDEVILGYAGNTAPEFYDIRYQYLPVMFVGSTQGGRVVDPEREIVAVSTNNLQRFIDGRADYRWLLEREPLARAGYSIYLYDITGDAEAHRRLARIYRSMGHPVLAARESEKGGGWP